MAVINKKHAFATPPADNFIDGFIGVNKCGKSTTAKKIAEMWRASHDDSMEIYGHDPQRMFDGLIPAKNRIQTEDKHWALKCGKLRNCLLILDEIKQLVPTPQHPPKGMTTLFSQAFFWNISIIWTGHNPARIPDACTDYTTMYHLFLTFARDGQFKKGIPNYSLCIAASNYVNKYVARYGRGKHRLDPGYLGQGFPYMIVNAETHQLTGVNMSKPL